MKPELLDAWITDLRSNPPQVKHWLHTCEGSCCLGRLSIVARLEQKYDARNRSTLFRAADEHNWNSSLLGYGIGEALGISQNQTEYLASMNDSGASFSDIADYLEANREVFINTHSYYE